MSRLFLVTGLPGAGKTTLARQLAQRHAAVHLSPDDWLRDLHLDPLDAPLRRRTERRLWSLGQELLAQSVPVVVDFGSWSRLERERMRRAARDLGVGAELHALDVPLEERWRRLLRRSAEPGAVRVTREHLVALETFWQPPDAAERASYDVPLGSRSAETRPR